MRGGGEDVMHLGYHPFCVPDHPLVGVAALPGRPSRSAFFKKKRCSFLKKRTKKLLSVWCG
jgi:hypothetical protein